MSHIVCKILAVKLKESLVSHTLCYLYSSVQRRLTVPGPRHDFDTRSNENENQILTGPMLDRQ